MLAAYPGHGNADLARLALLTPQTMSVIVANLLKTVLIARQPHRVHGCIQTNALEADMLRDLGSAEQAVISQWLVRIARAGTA